MTTVTDLAVPMQAIAISVELSVFIGCHSCDYFLVGWVSDVLYVLYVHTCTSPANNACNEDAVMLNMNIRSLGSVQDNNQQGRRVSRSKLIQRACENASV